MDQNKVGPAVVGFVILVVVLIIISSGCFYVVAPGTRGVKVTLGKVGEQFVPGGAAPHRDPSCRDSAAGGGD